MKNKIKFAIVGCGYIGKRHATMIMDNPESKLVALCDIEPEESLELSPFKASFFSSITSLLESNLDFDVLCICTPNGLHAEHACLALDAGKHVVVEKPLALKKVECETLLYKALSASKQVFCVMQNRYSPPSVWLKNIIENHLLGDIFMVVINCFWNRDDRYYFKNGKKHVWKGTQDLDGGVLFTQFSHFIDITYWLFGDIKDIQGKFNDFTHNHSTEFEDSGSISFNFLKGGMGCLNYSTAIYNSNLESSITIIGSKGSVKVGGQYMNEVEYCNIENYSMPELPKGNSANDYGGYKGSANNHEYVFENVIDVLKGRKSINTNALEGLKVVDIIERIYNLRDNKYSQPIRKQGKSIFDQISTKVILPVKY
jgi:predicted dehydrogenase